MKRRRKDEGGRLNKEMPRQDSDTMRGPNTDNLSQSLIFFPFSAFILHPSAFLTGGLIGPE